MSEELLCLPCNEPLSPSIFMMRDSGGDEDQGWQNVEDAPITVERGENMRAADPDVVTTSKRRMCTTSTSGSRAQNAFSRFGGAPQSDSPSICLVVPALRSGSTSQQSSFSAGRNFPPHDPSPCLGLLLRPQYSR